MFNRLVVCFVILTAAATLAEELELPFVVDSKKAALLVEAKIQGRTGTLLLDTGSAYTILRPEIVDLSSMDLKKARFASNGVGMQTEGLWVLAEVGLAGRSWKHKVAVVDFNLSGHYDRRVDGLLGQDLLRTFRSVTIDFEAGKIYLRR